MARLTLDEQILVLLIAKESCRMEDIRCDYSSGMCCYITNALFKYNCINCTSSSIALYIPIFTLYNVEMLTLGTKLCPNEKEFSPYWWDRENFKVRVEVFNLLLDELESNRSFLYKWYKRLTYLFK